MYNIYYFIGKIKKYTRKNLLTNFNLKFTQYG